MTVSAISIAPNRIETARISEMIIIRNLIDQSITEKITPEISTYLYMARLYVAKAITEALQ